MKKWQQGLAAGLAAMVLVSSSAVGLADERDDKLKEAAEQLQKMNEASSRVDTISEQLRQMQGEVDEATSEYKRVKGNLDEVQGRIDENKVLLDKTEKELKAKSKVLDKRVRDIYINGQISYIDVLFGAKDFSDFMTRMDLLKRIIKYDYDLVVKVQQDKAVIVSAQEQLDKDKEAAASLVKDAETKKNDMLTKKKNKDKLLEKAKYDRDTSERAYNELMAASRQIANMIRSRGSSGSSTASGSGAMIWPISGEVTSEFGWRTHPIFGTARFHSGLDIAGDYGMAIHAAASGTVTYAGWISGYGNAVIIDHGGGITTLYGHNESLAVSEGQSVSQGQTIAYCGSTGNSTGPHCHFEVRQNGEPVSPYGYL